MTEDDALAEGALASENVVIVTNLTAAESAAVTEVWTITLYPNGVINEVGVASDSYTLGPARRTGSLDESANATERWALSINAVASDTAAVASETWAASLLTKVSETARASATILATTAYKISSASSATASEAWVFEHTRSLSDSAAASDAVSFTYAGGVQVHENANAAEGWTPKRTVQATIHDSAVASMQLDPASAYNLTMVEYAEAADWASPNNHVSAWAINSRTQFISEYTNFDFNSFAQVGRKFIAADENGLYELTGPTDDGADVIGRLGSGFFAPNGPKNNGFKAAYISARGQGRYLLKLVSGDGREWVYQTTLNPGLMSTKINMGKGLNAHLYRWELIAADGQDFDLNAFELIPSMSGRRV